MNESFGPLIVGSLDGSLILLDKFSFVSNAIISFLYISIVNPSNRYLYISFSFILIKLIDGIKLLISWFKFFKKLLTSDLFDKYFSIKLFVCVEEETL